MNNNIKWLGTHDVDLYGFHGAYHHQAPIAVKYYNNKITARREKYPLNVEEPALTVGKEITEKGHHKVENFFDDNEKKLLLEIKNTLSEYVDNNIHIKRRDKNMAFVNQPILNIPNLYKIIFNQKLIDIVASYFNCIPAITSIAVRKSFVTDAPPVNNKFFHRDYNSLVKLLKVIVYLNDVDESAGPFSYVEGSHKKMFDGWWHHHYLQDDFLKSLYGQDCLKNMTANFGDIGFADTRGFHRGLKPKNKERYAMHMCFLVHPELGGPGHQQENTVDNWFQIDQKDYENIPDNLKPVADYLVKV